MGCQERIRKHLKSTGLYRLDGTSLVEAEMYAYAKVMEQIQGEIQKLLTSCFFDRIDNSKASYYEDLFGLPATRFPLTEERETERRYKIELMKKRLKVKNSDFSASALKEQIETGGMTVSFTEDFKTKTITVNVLQDKGYIQTQAEKLAFIKQLLPCHSTVIVNF